ncbi:hypothetical protein DQ04_10921010 [Trypanosoma grayi]|uniref:hypothetical protein n=1 Tax=Trypanosoma grayi TaxID=71804 RepID=UPI0004F41E83|nr:hypothetical protein DQ04_10921010 [Trypanosoma grayi]KEG07097.1 hypothetical protein DQ04_10921010 [Trypanosoma grayi]
MSAGTAAAATAPGMPVLPANPIDYPIMFVRQDEEEAAAVPPVTLFTALQWLLPVFQLAGWLSKHIGREGDRSGADPTPAVTSVTEAAEVDEARRLLPHFEPFFTSESRVIPNGALLYTVQTFRFPTPRGPRSITRALVETPAKYFSPLQEEKGGGHFLCCYEDRRLLRHFTYVQLDQLRFAWVAVKELLEEHKAVQRTDGALTGLARRDIKKNNSASAQDTDGVAGGGSGTSSKNPVSVYPSTSSTAAAAALPAPIAKRPHPSSNVITGPTAEARKTREEMREKKYMSDLLRDECAARWPHTPVHKSVIFVVEEQQQEAVGGRKGRKGPRTYLATVELPLLNKKGGTAAFRAPQWCTTRRDAENAAAEVALRALRSSKS